jgi:sec-independent protein translocase protein TatC
VGIDRAYRRYAGLPLVLAGTLAGRDGPDGEAPGMTLAEHLAELRTRLIKALLAVAAGMIVAFAYREHLLYLLLKVGRLDSVYVPDPMGGFMLSFQIALTAGIGLASPVVVYQAVAFVLPAMTVREKRVFFAALPFVVVCFAAGVLFGYVVTLPLALEYLLGYTMGDHVHYLPQAGPYIDFVTTLLLGLGLAFELPVVLWVLARLGLVTTERLVRFRKYAILAAFVIAAVITPTPDPVNQALIALPLWALYELGIVSSRFT